MKRSGFRYILSILAMVLAGWGCDLPDNAASQMGSSAATQTMQALATEVELTLQPDMDSQEEAEADPEADDSPAGEATVTPTLGAPMVSVSVDTNCRYGPGDVYAYQGALLVGGKAPVLGKLADESFWYIENPDPPPPDCWIWGAYAQITGDTSGLPILTPPPTPTETPIPMDFSISIATVTNCMLIFGVNVRVENTGSVTFESNQVTVTVSDFGETAAGDRDSFRPNTSCNFGVPSETLPPGAEGYLFAHGFDDNPTGHNVTVTVRLCTEDGLGGDCVQKTVSGVVPSP